MAANPTATEAGGGKGDKEDGEQDGGGGGGGGSDAEVEAGVASPTLPWDDDGLQAEVEVEEEQQPAKKQKSMVDVRAGYSTASLPAGPRARASPESCVLSRLRGCFGCPSFQILVQTY